MEQEKLLEQLQAICPRECTVKILQTKRRGNIQLIVICYPQEEITPTYGLDDWAIDEILPLHLDKIFPLIEELGYRYRAIYCCGDNFVFYTPHNSVFRKFSGAMNGICYGEHEYQKYVGVCADIKELIGYLTTVEDVVF